MLAAARRFGEFDKPVLLAWGRRRTSSRSSTARRLARGFPNGRLERIDRTRARSCPRTSRSGWRSWSPRSRGSRRSQASSRLAGRRPIACRAGPPRAAACASVAERRLDPRHQARRQAEHAGAVAQRERRDVDLGAVLARCPCITAAATCSGVRVPTPRGSFMPLSANMPASRMKPGKTVVTPTPVPRSSSLSA